MFCNLCGAQNEAEARFCRSCGQPMRVSRPPAPEMPVPAVPWHPGQPQNPYSPPHAPINEASARDNQVYQPHVDNHLVLSILSMILCCLPVGGVALYHSLQVRSHVGRGDYTAAERSSQLAKWWALGAIGANLLVTLGTLGFGLLVSLMSDRW